MKILVVSDTHGEYDNLLDSIIYEDFDMVFHLGDYVEDGEYIRDALQVPSIIVKGNGDYGSIYKDEELIEVKGKKFFLTHGHLYNIRNRIDDLYYRSLEVGAAVALFGHTHIPVNFIENGLVFMNPGSPSYPRWDHDKLNKEKRFTYGIIHMGDEIRTEIIEI